MSDAQQIVVSNETIHEGVRAVVEVLNGANPLHYRKQLDRIEPILKAVTRGDAVIVPVEALKGTLPEATPEATGEPDVEQAIARQRGT